ncbi:restriction endonuclease [Flavobacterium sp. CLA17]|uniref:nSTAND3 domain-containing NTPase n=1 Tax=Flavobacterium sp. CLA17 TaxID=2724135 RepID=UPI001491A182|nr:restriction endonuclease [Flavobacterium sp. CLA17]QSB28467.1 restriction endonuclease [Flavobacterium sp. CLA17]
MANYDFSTLNDRDLEELTRDLLSKELNVNFQSFKPGPDKGIDLRYSTVNDENEIIVQVKHYLGSGISKLKLDLKNNEIQKVVLLKPKRYLFCTSLPLSPQDKEEIKNIFNPYIQSTSDVIGKEDLNKWLDDYPEIQERHFKLWLSSLDIIKKIVKNGVKGRSEFYKEKILKEIKVYVPNKTHNEAVNALNNNHFILITGAPGIGKSTLANMLTYQFLAEDFELVYVREITEAEEVFSPEKKQIFYFDDFLGAITLDLYSSRNADSAIVNFIERVRDDKHKRLILTCRTTILNQAKNISDKIQNSNIDISNYEVKIENYTDWDKARILYNHIYLSDIEVNQKFIFFQNDFHWKVIKHRYYNPRVIQDITKKNNIIDSDYSEKFVLDILNDPKKIWEKPFNVQISHISRLLLLTMYSLGGGIYYVTDERLKEAFNSRINLEVVYNNYQRKGNEYNFALKELVGAFIIRTIDKNNIRYSFFNPSIDDFIFAYFQNSNEEYLQLLKSSVFFEQFKYRIATTIVKGEKRIDFSNKNSRKKLYEIFEEKKKLLKGFHSDSNLDIISTLIRLFNKNEIEVELLERINDLDISYLSWDDRDNLTEILKYIAQNNLVQQIKNLSELIKILSKDVISHYQIKSFASLIKENSNYTDFINDSKISDCDYYNEIQKNINDSWEKLSNDYMTDAYGIDKTLEEDELDDIINKRKEEAIQINKDIGLEGSEAIIEYEFDISSQIEFNKEKSKENDIKIQGYKENTRDEVLDINRLFNSNSKGGNLFMVPF